MEMLLRQKVCKSNTYISNIQTLVDVIDTITDN